jgi:hypothetical protein
MIITLSDLLFELSEASEKSDTDRVMLNVGGRWTNIEAVYIDGETGGIFIESED